MKRKSIDFLEQITPAKETKIVQLGLTEREALHLFRFIRRPNRIDDWHDSLPIIRRRLADLLDLEADETKDGSEL